VNVHLTCFGSTDVVAIDSVGGTHNEK
jgi:hypothetical protein